MAEALLRDETMTGRELASWVLPGLPDRITARELVRLRVREEVARFNAAGGGTFQGLVRPATPGRARADWAAQADTACAAFERNGFIMLAGDRQVEDLDELLDLRSCGTVSFIRLVPLVGG